MATKKPATKTTRAVVKEVADAVEENIAKAVSNGGRAKFDVASYYRKTVDDVSRQQGVDADPMENMIPMSSVLLMLDLIYGGGLRPAMYTHAGDEQTAKTTLA